MWTCPTCGRSFAKTNQSHYCTRIDTIDEYIATQPEQQQAYLSKIRELIAAALPEATEKLSWQMPTFWQGRNIIQFAAFQKHIGLYPGPEAVAFFAQELKDFKTSKGTIQLPLNKPLPEELIGAMARWCLNERT